MRFDISLARAYLCIYIWRQQLFPGSLSYTPSFAAAQSLLRMDSRLEQRLTATHFISKCHVQRAEIVRFLSFSLSLPRRLLSVIKAVLHLWVKWGGERGLRRLSHHKELKIPPWIWEGRQERLEPSARGSGDNLHTYYVPGPAPSDEDKEMKRHIIISAFREMRASLVAQTVKNLP